MTAIPDRAGRERSLTGWPQLDWRASFVPLALVLALLPPLTAAVLARGGAVLWMAGLAALAGLAWSFLFARLRRRPIGLQWLSSALVLALLVPADLPIWQLVLAQSFGMVAGSLVFGGRGYGFVGPGTVALAFLLFSFPALQLSSQDGLMSLAVLGSAVLLVGFGLVSGWQLLAGAGCYAIAVAGTGAVDPIALLGDGGFWLALVFLAGDLDARALTRMGRLVQGALYGLLLALFSLAAASPLPHAAVFAALLASVAAPLADQLVIALNFWRRSGRYG